MPATGGTPIPGTWYATAPSPASGPPTAASRSRRRHRPRGPCRRRRSWGRCDRH